MREVHHGDNALFCQERASLPELTCEVYSVGADHPLPGATEEWREAHAERRTGLPSAASEDIVLC